MGRPSFSTGARLPGAGSQSARVRVICDSASDILPSHARAMGILVVPNRIVFDGRILRDGVEINASEFYARLPHVTSMPHTEPAPPEDLYYAYQTAFREGATGILSIHVSSHLSRVVQNATMVRDYMVGAPIEIVDSLQAGIGMWPAIIRAAQLARLGAPMPELRHLVASTLARTRLFFMVESLEFLRRSGRVGLARQLLGTALDAHPILTIQRGEVGTAETVRPRSRALLRMRDLALGEGEVESLVLCGTSIESIAQVEAILRQRYRGAIEKTWLGPTLGVNTGPATAIAVVVR